MEPEQQGDQSTAEGDVLHIVHIHVRLLEKNMHAMNIVNVEKLLQYNKHDITMCNNINT